MRKLRIALQQRGRRPTELGAIPIEPDAFRHHRDMGLAQAGREAILAGSRTLKTGLDTRFMICTRHDFNP
jgi:hypothetical protein